ncbi:type II toxin-antitoxin system Phd/YefM family antitoxin [Cupriavidus sp. CuC1]|uniref:type II toxin-antitoxin system Phd/YefM family antitoxin n=1 Tax=Cupriavidus TaxID=106589 RepID=UPI00296A9080|nr:type II toxin-antitoxin system Phd/YefM family antitoxin [Cupriavidus sp. CV2]MDW3682009.1 type II toxin-antitoxin system Phd/YefM family antitoxin [Cupriavidus sp. CV2]
MLIVNMHDAKSGLSRLVEAIESGEEKEVVIARNGKPAAKLVPILPPEKDVARRIGAGKAVLANWQSFSLEQFNAADDEVARLFGVGEPGSTKR